MKEKIMKRKVLFIVALPLLLVSQAFACEGVSENAAAMHAAIAKTSTPENVRAVSLHNKAMYCKQSAINLRLQGDAQANYVASCINQNDALELKASTLKGHKI
jgi:hypothetical protein